VHFLCTPALSPAGSPGVSPRSVMSTCTNGSRFLAAAPHVPTVRLGNLMKDVVQWCDHGETEVTTLQARIDDMWVEEVVLGCDTEIYGGIRQAALEVEAGTRDTDSAVRQAHLLTEEAESTALHAVRTRMVARDCVRYQGGVEALQSRIKRRVGETSASVRPYMERLKDAERAPEVVRVMDRLLREAQEEYASVNAMKTAKSEVVLELQDKVSQREWMQRQLSMSLDILEASQLFGPNAAPRDAEHFFVETVRSCDPDDPLRQRTLRCLEHLRLWGNAAAGALAAVGSVDVDDTDGASVAGRCEEDRSKASPARAAEEASVSGECTPSRAVLASVQQSPASDSGTSVPDLS